MKSNVYVNHSVHAEELDLRVVFGGMLKVMQWCKHVLFWLLSCKIFGERSDNQDENNTTKNRKKI